MAPVEKMQGQGSLCHKIELPMAAGRDKVTQESSRQRSLAKELSGLNTLTLNKQDRLFHFLSQALPKEVFMASEAGGLLHDQLLPSSVSQTRPSLPTTFPDPHCPQGHLHSFLHVVGHCPHIYLVTLCHVSQPGCSPARADSPKALPQPFSEASSKKQRILIL